MELQKVSGWVSKESPGVIPGVAVVTIPFLENPTTKQAKEIANTYIYGISN